MDNLEIAIVIFAYNRPLHLQSTLNSLARNAEAKNLPLVVFIDGPRSIDDAGLTKQVERIVDNANGFSSVTSFARKNNLGLYKSITLGVTEILKDYEAIIVVEDDMITSPYFIRYMLGGLNRYKNDQRVASIHGYLPPINASLPNTFFLPGADCWGWSTWRDRWHLFRGDASQMVYEIKSKNLTRKFNLNGNYDYMRMLENKSLGFNNSWAICWYASCFLAKKLTLYPGRSLVQNIGLDSSGENCSETDCWFMTTSLTKGPINIGKIPVEFNPKLFNIYSNYYRFRRYRTFINRVSKKLKVFVQKFYRKLYRFLRLSTLELTGPYKTFEDALENSSGYHHEIISSKVLHGVLCLINNQAIYERDGTVFTDRPNGLPIEIVIRSLRSKVDCIVDFGGGLGGLFLSYKDIIPEHISRHVIEQQSMVKIGNKISTEYNLKINFHVDTDHMELENRNTLLIVSCVLSYLSEWKNKFSNIIFTLNPKYIFVDRQAFSRFDWDLHYIQHEDDYYEEPISYPFSLISSSEFMTILRRSGYKVVDSGESPIHRGFPVHRYMLFIRSSLKSDIAN